jgi:hypothetical protein
MKVLEDALPDDASVATESSVPNTSWADFSKMDSQLTSSTDEKTG